MVKRHILQLEVTCVISGNFPTLSQSLRERLSEEKGLDPLAKMGPFWPPVGGSSQSSKEGPFQVPIRHIVKVVGLRVKPLLMISTSELAQNGRHSL